MIGLIFYICALILGVPIFIGFGIWIYVVFRSKKNTPDKDTPDRKRRVWFNTAILWLVIEYLGVILPFECTAIILYLDVYSNSDISNKGIFVFSVLSMLLIIFTYAIRPHSHAVAYRKAYLLLHKTIYNSQSKSEDDTNIYEAICRGEYYINSVYDIDSDIFRKADNDDKQQDTKEKKATT